MIKDGKISVFRIVDYLIILLVILNSGFALTTGMNDLLLYSQIFLLGLIVVANGRFFKLPKRDIRQIVIIVMVVSMISAFIINMDFKASLTYLHCALYIAIAYLINLVYDSNSIITAFIKIMRVVAIVSVSVSLLNLIIPFSAYSFTVTNGSDVKYYTLGVVNYNKTTFSIQPRACGIFWEPGLYAGFLGITSIFELLTSKSKISIWWLCLYCVAIFFTYSTAGYIYILMIIILAFSKRFKSIGSIIIFSIVGVALLLCIINIDFVTSLLIKISPNVFSKILWRNESYLTRSMSPIADLLIIFRHPLGVGYGNIQNIRVETIQSMGENVSLSTSTLTYHGACCGILFLLSYNILWVKNLIVIKKDVLFKILTIILFAMILTSNPMYNNQFIWIFLFFPFTRMTELDFRSLNSSGVGE